MQHLQFHISHLLVHWLFYLTHRSGATTPGQSGPGNNGNGGILHNPQSSKAEASLSDGFMSYTGHSLEKGGLTLQQSFCQRILQPQPTGLRLKFQHML